jgi:predicted TIM-barrel fold metal-dependent hydrolase
MSGAPRIIDAHAHADWLGHDLTHTLANMDQYGIDRAWLLSWECPEDEYPPTPSLFYREPGGPIPFARAVSYCERAPGRFVLGYCPDPRRPDAVTRLQAARDIYGVQVCGELKLRMVLDNPDALRLFRYCGSVGMPVTVHIDYEHPTGHSSPRPNWWYGGGVEALERALIACPETTFLGHAPGFWAHISGSGVEVDNPYPTGPVTPDGLVPRLLRTYPNLWCDLSAGSAHNALSRDMAFGREFVLEFQDRLLYARDQFDNIHQELLNAFDLPSGALAKIMAGNALRLAPVA